MKTCHGFKNGFDEQGDEGERHYDAFKNPLTTVAAIDRVVHHSVILDLMQVRSFRVQQATGQQTSTTDAHS